MCNVRALSRCAHPTVVKMAKCNILALVFYSWLLQETKAAVMQNSALCACLIDAAAVADISHVAGSWPHVMWDVRCVTCDVICLRGNTPCLYSALSFHPLAFVPMAFLPSEHP